MPNNVKFNFPQQLFFIVFLALAVWDICFNKNVFNIYHLGLALLMYIFIFDKSKINSLRKIIKSLKGNDKEKSSATTSTIIIFPQLKEYYNPDEEKLSYDKKYSSIIKDSTTIENLNNNLIKNNHDQKSNPKN